MCDRFPTYRWGCLKFPSLLHFNDNKLNTLYFQFLLFKSKLIWQDYYTSTEYQSIKNDKSIRLNTICFGFNQDNITRCTFYTKINILKINDLVVSKIIFAMDMFLRFWMKIRSMVPFLQSTQSRLKFKCSFIRYILDLRITILQMYFVICQVFYLFIFVN